jgi:hypothetical protein
MKDVHIGNRQSSSSSHHNAIKHMKHDSEGDDNITRQRDRMSLILTLTSNDNECRSLLSISSVTVALTDFGSKFRGALVRDS